MFFLHLFVCSGACLNRCTFTLHVWGRCRVEGRFLALRPAEHVRFGLKSRCTESEEELNCTAKLWLLFCGAPGAKVQPCAFLLVSYTASASRMGLFMARTTLVALTTSLRGVVPGPPCLARHTWLHTVIDECHCATRPLKRRTRHFTKNHCDLQYPRVLSAQRISKPP